MCALTMIYLVKQVSSENKTVAEYCKSLCVALSIQRPNSTPSGSLPLPRSLIVGTWKGCMFSSRKTFQTISFLMFLHSSAAIGCVLVDGKVAKRYSTRFSVSLVDTLHSCTVLSFVIWKHNVSRRRRSLFVKWYGAKYAFPEDTFRTSSVLRVREQLLGVN